MQTRSPRLLLLFFLVLILTGVYHVLYSTSPAAFSPFREAIPLLAFGALAWLAHRPRIAAWVARGLRDDETAAVGTHKARGSDLAWLGWGLGCVVVALVLVEVRQPFYFTQQDAFATELPATLFSCRALERGLFPEWNPYEYMGAPWAASGLPGVTYPPMMLCYLLARHLLGNEYLTFEIFAWLHLLVGFVAMYWAGRLLGLRPVLAASAGLSVVLAGYTLIAGRSWHSVVALVPYLPLLVASVALVRRGPVGWKWLTFTGLTIALLFHVGFTQLWLYAVGFWFLGVALLLVLGEAPLRRVLLALPALGLGLGLSAPVMFTEWRLLSHLAGFAPAEVARNMPGVWLGRWAMLLPYPLAHAAHPNGWGNVALPYMGDFYYSGTVFTLVSLTGLISLLFFRWRRHDFAANLWLLLAGVAFLGALGREGPLWPLLVRLPVLERFQHPFRFLSYYLCFAALGAGLCLERLLRQCPRPARLEAGFGLGFGLLMLYTAYCAQPSFYTYGDRPYPPLPVEMTQLLAPENGPYPQRVLSIAPTASGQRGFVETLAKGFAPLYKVFAFAGYDPAAAALAESLGAITALQREPLDGARAYGIRWIFLARNGAQMPPALEPAVTLRLNFPQVSVWEVSDPCPLAFSTSAPRLPLPVEFSPRGASVDFAPPGGGEVVLNVLWRQWMTLMADGAPVRGGPDSWGRLRVMVPPGARRLEMRYAPPWRSGLLMGCLILLGSLALGAVLLRA